MQQIFNEPIKTPIPVAGSADENILNEKKNDFFSDYFKMCSEVNKKILFNAHVNHSKMNILGT